MTERVQAYLLYEPGFDEEAKLDLLEGIYDLRTVEPGKGLETVVEEKEEADFFVVDVAYGTPVVTLNLDPDHPENLPDVPVVTVGMDESNFLPSTFGEEHVDVAVADYVDFVAQLYDLSADMGRPPRYVAGTDPNQVDALHGRFGWSVDVTGDGVANGDVEQVFWLQVLPPAAVEGLGRERVLSSPAASVETFDDGAVLLVAYERPYPPGDPTPVADHLGVPARQYFS